MKLGSLSLENNLILAPMAGITTGPYRRFCRKFNKIGLVNVPMLYTKRIEKNYKSVERELYHIEQERPISIQLIGSNLFALKKSIDVLSSYNFDVLDINAGCPSKRAIKAKEGGYLMTDLELLNSIIGTATKHSPQPVSLKVRIGYNNTDNLKNFINIIKNSNISFLTVHGRNVRDKFINSTLNLDAIKQIKNAINIPVIGNGNIDNPVFAKNFIDYTGVDGIMIGRGSMGNPEIFRQIEEFILKAELNFFVNDLRKMEKYGILYEECIDDYLSNNQYLPCSAENYKFIELKRNMIWFTKQIVNSTNMRIKLAQTRNLKDLKETIKKTLYQ